MSVRNLYFETHNQGVAGSSPAGPTLKRARVRARASTIALFLYTHSHTYSFRFPPGNTPGFIKIGDKVDMPVNLSTIGRTILRSAGKTILNKK
jgi:hypothetical protein